MSYNPRKMLNEFQDGMGKVKETNEEQFEAFMNMYNFVVVNLKKPSIKIIENSGKDAPCKAGIGLTNIVLCI